LNVRAYYNEIDPFAAQWLRNLIAAGHIAPGDVDERSIVDVQPDDLREYAQAHFFAGIGGWSYALRLAGWPDDRPVWTGSCPCQPFSLAGKQKGFADERHLWPMWRELIRECNPAIIFGEQVASATDWLRLVRGDLEAMGRAVGAIPFQAASAGAEHLRDRYGFVAYANHPGPQGWRLLSECAGERTVRSDGLANSAGTGSLPGPQSAVYREKEGAGSRHGQPERCGDVVHAESVTKREQNDQSDAITDGGQARPIPSRPSDSFEWVLGADGKARRVKPGIRLLAHGVPNRVGLLRGFGNAIDPRAFKQFILASQEAIGDMR
jgi:DNA (cytosine-5)-methyltransferase 1